MVGLKLWRGCSGRYILSFVATEIKIPTAHNIGSARSNTWDR